MNNYQLVLFDMDGTLLDSGAAHQVMFSRFWEKYADGRPAMDPAGAPTIWDCFRPSGVRHEDMEEIYRQLDGFYRQEADDIISRLHFLPAAFQLLRTLKNAGVLTALVSNSHTALVDEIVKVNGAGALFDVLSGSTFAQEDKPERLTAACRQLHIAPEKALYVGDNEADGRTGHRTGLDCAIVLSPISWLRSPAVLLEEVRPTYIVYALGSIAYIAV